MKNNKIIHAYDSAGPDNGAEERIWQRIRQAAEAPVERKPVRLSGLAAQDADAPRIIEARKCRPFLRSALSAAACVASRRAPVFACRAGPSAKEPKTTSVFHLFQVQNNKKQKTY